MKNNRLIVNICSSLFSYGALLIFSVATAHFVLQSYGSEVNGFLSSVNQIFSYIALLEAGIGTATVRALYKPINQKDSSEIADTLAASRKYYRISAVWYFLCVIAVSFIWPFILDTVIPYWTICGVIFFHGVSGVITYWYTSTIVNYLVAAGKNYINNHVHIAGTLLTYILKIIICYSGVNIVFISISLIAVNVVKCLIYRWYMKRIFPEFFKARKAQTSLLKQRNAFLIHEISGVIFSSTDTILISAFCGLKDVSVYAVYALVVSSLKNIIGQIFNGTKYVLGDGYQKNREDYIKIHDTYNSIYICIVFILFTVAYIMLIPFVSLYTRGITDINYLDARLPLMFVMIELLSACRIVDNELIRVALHADKTVSRTVTEAAINLIISLILVNYIGIYGVLTGTIIALLYRSNDIICYANHRILSRSVKTEYGIVLMNFSVFAAMALCSRVIPIRAYNLIGWVMAASVVFIITAAVFLTINILMNKQLRMFLSMQKRKVAGIFGK